MKTSGDELPELTKKLIQKFAKQTGLKTDEDVKKDRYLWADAFAVQNFLALSSLIK